MRSWSRAVSVLVSLAVLIPATTTVLSAASSAEGANEVGWQGWGIRFGASAHLDQVFAGAHFNSGEFAKDVGFRGTAEVGTGDDRVLVQGLAEVHYVFSKVQPWKPYVGGGIGLT